MNHKFSVGERVSSLRNDRNHGTVLDYSGVIKAISDDGLRAAVKFSDGETVSLSTHQDFTESMETAYDYAMRFLVTAEHEGGVIPTEQSFARITARCVRRPNFFDTARALWVLRYDPEGALR